MTTFWGQNLMSIIHALLTLFYTLRSLQQYKNVLNQSLYVEAMPLVS